MSKNDKEKRILRRVIKQSMIIGDNATELALREKSIAPLKQANLAYGNVIKAIGKIMILKGITGS